MSLGTCPYQFYEQSDAGIVERSVKKENSLEGTRVGAPVIALDEDKGQSLQYAIISGNELNIFRIVACNGQIEVNTAILNFEQQVNYDLRVQVKDNGLNPPSLSSTINIRITVKDANDPPEIASQQLSVNEGVLNGTLVGNHFDVIDEDANEVYTYALIDDDEGRFKLLHNVDGVYLAVAGDGELDYETATQHHVSLEVTDGGALGTSLSGRANFVVEILDVNEPPSSINKILRVSENIDSGATIHTALDLIDEDVGQTFLYSGVGIATCQILDHDVNSDDDSCEWNMNMTVGDLLTVDAENGNFIVVDGSQFDYEDLLYYKILIRATDNGTPQQYSDSTVTILLEDYNELPEVLSSVNFNISEGGVRPTQYVPKKDGLPQSLIGYWPLEESSGKILDMGDYSLHADFVGDRIKTEDGNDGGVAHDFTDVATIVYNPKARGYSSQAVFDIHICMDLPFYF